MAKKKRGRPPKKKQLEEISLGPPQKFSFDLPVIEYLQSLQYVVRSMIEEKMKEITNDPICMNLETARKAVKELGLEKYEGFIDINDRYSIRSMEIAR